MKIITAEELRAFLREHDLTATALAREAGVSVQALTRPLQHKKSGRNPWLGVEASRKVIPAMERIAKRSAPQSEKGGGVMSRSTTITFKTASEIIELLERIEQKINEQSQPQTPMARLEGETGTENARALDPFEAGAKRK